MSVRRLSIEQRPCATHPSASPMRAGESVLSASHLSSLLFVIPSYHPLPVTTSPNLSTQSTRKLGGGGKKKLTSRRSGRSSRSLRAHDFGARRDVARGLVCGLVRHLAWLRLRYWGMLCDLRDWEAGSWRAGESACGDGREPRCAKSKLCTLCTAGRSSF